MENYGIPMTSVATEKGKTMSERCFDGGKRGRVMVRYDPYTDSFIDNPTKETTVTINLDAFPKSIIQLNVVEVSDESIEKIADAVVRKLADHKTEPSNSEIPNNCEDEPQTIRCPKCGRTDYIRDMEKDMGIKGSHYKYKCINCNTYIKDEPTISKMEQVDKDINVRSKERSSE